MGFHALSGPGEDRILAKLGRVLGRIQRAVSQVSVTDTVQPVIDVTDEGWETKYAKRTVDCHISASITLEDGTYTTRVRKVFAAPGANVFKLFFTVRAVDVNGVESSVNAQFEQQAAAGPLFREYSDPVLLSTETGAGVSPNRLVLVGGAGDTAIDVVVAYERRKLT